MTVSGLRDLNQDLSSDERGEANVARSRGAGGLLQDPGPRFVRLAIVVAFVVVQGL